MTAAAFNGGNVSAFFYQVVVYDNSHRDLVAVTTSGSLPPSALE